LLYYEIRRDVNNW